MQASTRANRKFPGWQDLAEQRLQMVQLLLRASTHPMHWLWAFSSPASMGRQGAGRSLSGPHALSSDD